jgi:hypothetical protein
MSKNCDRMLDEFGAEIEHADSRLDSTMKKMAKVLHLSNGNFLFFKLETSLANPE